MEWILRKTLPTLLFWRRRIRILWYRVVVFLILKVHIILLTMVSSNGVGVGLRTTSDWKTFEKKGMILVHT
jgi:hypothetical protein